MEPLIGIMGAFKEELEDIRREMKIEDRSTFSEVEFIQGNFVGKEVVLVLSGVGEEKASRVVDSLLGNFSLRALICLGIAGALHPTLDVGDIVIGKRIFSQSWVQQSLSSHEGLVEAAVHACDRLRYRFFLGDLLTVPRIIASSAEKKEIYQDTRALAVEMETATVARRAAQKKIPFLALRSISDGADYTFKIDISQITDAHGELNPRKVLRYLIRHPSSLGAFLQMKRNVTKATERLGKLMQSLVMEI